MFNKNITSIDKLPLEAKDFVDFINELIISDDFFIKEILNEINNISEGRSDKYDSKNEYLNSFIYASIANCSSEINVVNEFMEKYNCAGFSGAYKFTIVFADYDYVLKFPIRAEDHCLREANIYKGAVCEGLERHFAETYNLGKIKSFTKHGYKKNIYIQKKVNCVVENSELPVDRYNFWESGPADDYGCYYDNDFFDKKEVQNFDAFLQSRVPMNFSYLGVLFCMWRVYGDEEMMKLDDFLARNRINDLHSENAGFLTDDIKGAPILIDFSGC